MKIIIVDDEINASKYLNSIVTKLCPNEDIRVFNKSLKALDYAKSNLIDIAFLDIEMPELKGVDLARKLIETNKRINIIFTTGYEEFAKDALDMHASGYLLKPVMEKDVKKELEYLRYEVKRNTGLFIKTKDIFDVYYNEEIIPFKRSASKEMLAILVDAKGSAVSRKQICEYLFPGEEYDRNKQVYMSQIISGLIEILKQYNIDDILLKEYNSYKLDTSKYNSDIDSLSMQDNYMAQFSWGRDNKKNN